VGGSPTGIQGLDEVFAALYAAGRQPDEVGLGAELVKQLGKENYIPRSARDDFATAFLLEYRTYVTQRAGGNVPQPTDYGTWRGYPREQIPWFPTVDEELCNGCNVCLKICSTHALVPTTEGKVRLDDPFKCVVGCSSCATVCRPRAITFPPRSMLDAYRPLQK